MTDRIVCGWRVRSSLPLPETRPWRGGDRAVDIEISQGRVPERIGKRSADLPYIEAAPDGRLLVDATPVARFLVTANRVVVDTELAPAAPEWRAYLLGPVLAVICYLRGILPLHASALRIRGRAIAIAGRSGAGKSTLAAGLACRGHAVITDDICACVGLPSRPLVIPTYPAFKLSRESLQALQIDSHDLDPIGSNHEKLQLLRARGFDPKPVPLEAIYLIEDAPADGDGEDVILSASGTDAFARLSAEIYRPPIGRLLLAKPALFDMATRLATQVTIRRLVRRARFATLPALLKVIEADIAHLHEVA